MLFELLSLAEMACGQILLSIAFAFVGLVLNGCGDADSGNVVGGDTDDPFECVACDERHKDCLYFGSPHFDALAKTPFVYDSEDYCIACILTDYHGMLTKLIRDNNDTMHKFGHMWYNFHRDDYDFTEDLTHDLDAHAETRASVWRNELDACGLEEEHRVSVMKTLLEYEFLGAAPEFYSSWAGCAEMPAYELVTEDLETLDPEWHDAWMSDYGRLGLPCKACIAARQRENRYNIPDSLHLDLSGSDMFAELDRALMCSSEASNDDLNLIYEQAIIDIDHLAEAAVWCAGETGETTFRDQSSDLYAMRRWSYLYRASLLWYGSLEHITEYIRVNNYTSQDRYAGFCDSDEQ